MYQILDRLPTAKILSEDNGTYQLEAEVYGKGIEMCCGAREKTSKTSKLWSYEIKESYMGESPHGMAPLFVSRKSCYNEMKESG